MERESVNWLDYCQKFNEQVDTLTEYILMEYGCHKDINRVEDLDKRCRVKFEVYSHPVRIEYQERIDTLIQILRITEHLKGE